MVSVTVFQSVHKLTYFIYGNQWFNHLNCWLQFSLPILQELLEKPQPHFALILSPTRELAIQIAEQVEALGSGIGVKVTWRDKLTTKQSSLHWI